VFTAALAVATVTVVGADAAPAPAWPGDPDGSFASCGQKSIDITAGEPSEAAGVLMDADGSAVVAGWVGTRGLVARFTATGTLDDSFATGGKKTVGLGSDAEFAALARQADGKIVAVGSRTSGSSVDSLIARVTTAGQLDPSFHATGTLVDSHGAGDRLTAVRVQANGAILVGGSDGDEGFVARVSANGTPDATFSGDGERTGLPLTVAAMVQQPDGKIVVGGHTPDDDFALLRLNSDGTTDDGFGGTDGVAADLGGVDAVTALALDADGNVVAAGFGHGPSGKGHTIVRRYDATGTLDDDFAVTDRAFGLNDRPASVLVRGDGKVLVTGNSKVGTDNDVVLLQLNSDGTRDASFGIGGISLLDAGTYPVANDAARRADGRVLVAGSLRVAGRPRLALFRYQTDAATAARPAQGFVVDGTGALHGFAAGCTAKPATPGGNTKWPGKDTARGVALLTGGRGIVLEADGDLHPFRFGDGSVTNLAVSGNTRWPGKDSARGIAVVPEGTGGYVVNREGGLSAFRIGTGSRPPIPTGLTKWPGKDFARGVALLPNGEGGYVLDANGGLHPFGGAPKARAGAPSWPGQDRARGVAIAPDGSGGWVLDSLGNLYAFGIGTNPKPPAATGNPVWPGPIARGVAALP
jgi:uncharacterized delta-60 repeat protein